MTIPRRLAIACTGLALNMTLGLGVAGAAGADGSAPAGATMIDLTGQIVTAGLAGGIADPVPLFSGASGPVIFVLNLPGAAGEDSFTAARRGKSAFSQRFGPAQGVRAGGRFGVR